MKDDCIFAILMKLDVSKEAEQDYVFNFFTSALLSYLDKADASYRDWAVSTINGGLKAGDKRFHEFARRAMSYHAEFWKSSLKDAFDHFQEAPKVQEDDAEDAPF